MCSIHIISSVKLSTMVRSQNCILLHQQSFDRVWHRGLLHKLRGKGCSGKVLAWLSSYLSGRRQRLVLNGKFSKWVEVLAGVPQGYILCPVLFLIFINGIVKRIGGSIRLLADSTSLLSSLTCSSKQQGS